MTTQDRRLETAELDDDVMQVLRDLVLTLRDREPEDALRNLIILRESVADLLATSARTLASEQSWAAVGAVTGTSREAAWQRWAPPSPEAHTLTCPSGACTGQGRTLWRTHTRCPRCGGGLVRTADLAATEPAGETIRQATRGPRAR